MKQVITIPEGVKYISVELVDKSSLRGNCEIISGLFKGLAPLENNNVKQLFVLIAGKKEDTTNIYNTKYYNVVSVTVLGEDTKAITYFTLNSEDQNKAIELLKNVITVMEKNKRMLELDPDIIDMSTYTDTPNNTDNVDKTCSYPKAAIPTNNVANNYTSYEKKEPSPSVIKRTGIKKRTKKELLDMINRVKEVKNGTFVVKLPEIIEDDDVFNHYS